MKILKVGVILVSALVIIGCSKKEQTNNESQLKGVQEQTTKVVTEANFLDSIGDVTAQIAYLKAELVSKRSDLKAAISKRDSILSLVTQVESSLAKVNAVKIEPGITGVHTKLNELKGQKENLQEQLSLQEQEIALAKKKINLLGEEKIVYDAQRKVLWDKGAPPTDFIEVDTLLSGINQKISEQNTRLKNLNRNVSNIEEQITSIGEQRGSLSTKIRNNYTAQQIFDEYSKEEKDRLKLQLNSVDEKLTTLQAEEGALSIQLGKLTGEKSVYELKQDQLSRETIAKDLAVTQQQLDEKAAQKKTRITYTFVIIGLVSFVIILFYFLGKYKKSQKK